MIVQKPGMHKSVSHDLTLVKCLFEAGIANSKIEVLFMLLSWEISGKCFLNYSRKRTAMWRIKLHKKQIFSEFSWITGSLYFSIVLYERSETFRANIAKRQQIAVFWLCCLEWYSLREQNVICSKPLSICR